MPQVSGGVLSHWYELFENFSTSTQDFYRAVEEAIRSRKIPGVETSRVLFPEGGIGSPKREYLRLRRGRIVFDICSAPYGTSHFFSWWVAKIPARYGLPIVLGILFACFYVWNIFVNLVTMALINHPLDAFTVMVFLYAIGLPVSLLSLGIAVERGWIGDEEWVLSVPVFGYLYAVVFKPLSYYRLDTAYMFRDSIQAVVGEVINGLREERGLRLLEDDELEPHVSKEMQVRAR